MANLEQRMPNLDLPKAVDSAALKQLAFFSTQIAQARRFHLQVHSGVRKRLSVASGGCEVCSADYEIHRRGFPYFGLEFVAGGMGQLELRGSTCRLVPGTLFSYGPGISHDITTDPDEPLVKYFVDFTGTAARKLLEAIPLPPGSAAQTFAPAEIMPIFDELIRSGSRNSLQSTAICAALLEALLLKLAETRMPLGSVESLAFDTYQRCRRELEEHALELRSLHELAERCGVDEAYLCRLFQRFEHQSPYQRLMRLKMSYVAARMHSPGTLVKQVAAELGFTDPYHLSRAFKSVFGVSPTQLVREQTRPGPQSGRAPPRGM